MYIYVFIFLLLQGSRLCASDGQPANLTFFDIAKLAKQADLKTPARFFDVESNQAERRADNLLQNPSFSYQVGQANSGGYVGRTHEVAVAQTLPVLGAGVGLITGKSITSYHAQSKANDARFGAEKTQTQQLARDHVAETLLEAMQLCILQELAKHSEERQVRYQLLEKYLRHNVAPSPAARVDNLLIENQMLSAQKELLFIELQKQKLQSHIKFKLYIDGSGSLNIDPLWFDRGVALDQKRFRERVRASNSSLSVLRALLEAAYSETEAAELKRFPEFTLSAGYRFEDMAPSNTFVYGAMSAVIPLWNGGGHLVQSKRLHAESLKSALVAEEKQVDLQLQDLFYEYQYAAKLLETFSRTRVTDLEQRAEFAEKAFRTGRLSATQFLAIDTQIHTTLNSVFDAQLQYFKTILDLLNILAEEFGVHYRDSLL